MCLKEDTQEPKCQFWEVEKKYSYSTVLVQDIRSKWLQPSLDTARWREIQSICTESAGCYTLGLGQARRKLGMHCWQHSKGEMMRWHLSCTLATYSWESGCYSWASTENKWKPRQKGGKCTLAMSMLAHQYHLYTLDLCEADLPHPGTQASLIPFPLYLTR